MSDRLNSLWKLPPFYDAKNASCYGFYPQEQLLFEESTPWKKAHGITSSHRDPKSIHLLLIDVQKDFCFPEGSLYVGGRDGKGALDDNRKISEFIYRNINVITDITTTLDSHLAFQIFFSSFWIGADGQPISPYREITVEQIDRQEVRPSPAIARWLGDGNNPVDDKWLLRQVHYYCEELEKAGKYKLYLWPPHCLMGSHGHSLVGVIQEARLFHSFVRGAQSWVEMKGDNPLTENYSVFCPEVLSMHDGKPLARRNVSLLQRVLKSDVLIIAGQAASHCVKHSIDDLLKEIRRIDERMAQKVYLLEDCMSSVTIPDGNGGFVADFSPEALKALDRYANAGMHVVRSTVPVGEWPGIFQCI